MRIYWEEFSPAESIYDNKLRYRFNQARKHNESTYHHLHTLFSVNGVHVNVKFIQATRNRVQNDLHDIYNTNTYQKIGEVMPCHIAKSKLTCEKDFSPPERDLESL